MTKEEFLKQEEQDFDNLDLQNAIRLVKLYNGTARIYFHNWQQAVEEICKLKFTSSQSEKKVNDVIKEIQQKGRKQFGSSLVEIEIHTLKDILKKYIISKEG